jgi:hypothetical protein
MFLENEGSDLGAANSGNTGIEAAIHSVIAAPAVPAPTSLRGRARCLCDGQDAERQYGKSR